MKVTVFYLTDGLIQRKAHRGKRIRVHIHVGRTQHLYSSVIRMKRRCR